MVEPTIRAKLELVPSGGAIGGGGDSGGVFSKAEERAFRLEELKALRTSKGLGAFFLGGGLGKLLTSVLTSPLAIAIGAITAGSILGKPTEEEQKVIDETDPANTLQEAKEAVEQFAEGAKSVAEGLFEFDPEASLEENMDALKKSWGGLEDSSKAVNSSVKGLSDKLDSEGLPTFSSVFTLLLGLGAKVEVAATAVTTFVDAMIEAKNKLKTTSAIANISVADQKASSGAPAIPFPINEDIVNKNLITSANIAGQGQGFN